MKKNDFYSDLHIGKIIKEIASQKGISSKQIATVIHRYQNNADKIFKLEDMDIEDIIHISYLLEYNLLDLVSKKYLSHISCKSNLVVEETCWLKIDMLTLRVTTYEVKNDYNFFKKIYIGQHIKEVAEQKHWSEQMLAMKLNCSQSAISHLYNNKSLKVKSIIHISNVLQYHFITEVYLSKMSICPSSNILDNCIITFSPNQVRISNFHDKTVLMVFDRNNDKK